MSLLEMRNLSRNFGSFIAVNNVSLAVEAGELRAVIGPNGAGKTTFFNLISGFLPPSSGSIFFEGKDITAVPAHRRVAMGMARTFQVTEIFPGTAGAGKSAHRGGMRGGSAPFAISVARARATDRGTGR